MTTPAFSINSDSMQAIVSKAILEGIDAQQKDLLIEQAVKSLLVAPKSPGYGVQTKTPLQDAFDDAVRRTARTVVDEVIETEGLADRIRALVREQVTAALASDSTLAGGVGDAIGAAVRDVLRQRDQ